MFDLKGRVAVVTGGNGGIGLGMARGLATAGAGIVIAARTAEKSRRAVAEIEKLGAAAVAVSVDVTDETAVARLMTAIRKPIHEYTLGDWHRVLDTNLTSAFLCSHAAYPLMKHAGGGKVINIGSMMSIFGASFAPAYAASKGGMVQLTKSMASAWAADNIQVNAVLPGWIETDLTSAAKREVPGLNENVLRRTPAKRWGTIDDMSGVAVFLASAASDFVTGAAIAVDGGYSIQG